MQTPQQPLVRHLRRASTCFFLTLTLVAGGQSLAHGLTLPKNYLYGVQKSTLRPTITIGDRCENRYQDRDGRC